ncbi:MAG: sulfatase [Pirellulaceae bacterium]|nr:sulfatase [Pirellulaceae bacterium]
MHRFTHLIVSLLTAAAMWQVDQPLGAQERPNIVFILADDMGWPDLACYGHAFHETPVLDALASQGMKFSNFYATPVCSSTRSTILSGQYSARTGITDFIPGHWRPFERLVVPEIDHHLKDGVRTPGDALQAAGYATGHFGKWHVGNDREHQPDKHGYQVTERQLGKPFRQWRENPKPGPKRIDLLTDASLWFIEQHQDEPFFLTVSHHAVHIPVEGNAATIAKYEKKPKPAIGVNHPIYAAMVEDLDTSVARILQKLDALKLADTTIVVFASDNGGLQKIYTGVGETVSTNTPLRDEKGTLYEGGIRVPLIVRWPGVVEPGTVNHEPTTTSDLLPTFCEMAGATLPAQPIDGTSIVSLLHDPQASLKRDAIYFHYPHYHHSTPAGAIRMGDWKLIEFYADGRLELYNLANDISEKQNQASLRPELAVALQERLAAWRREVGARMPTVNPQSDPKRAADWWSRRTKKPLDIEAMRKRYDSKRSKSTSKS